MKAAVVLLRRLSISLGLLIAAVPTANQEVVWQHPVDAPIVDHFRPPGNRYGPGNRGLEYGTTVGQTIAAVAPGEVVFAGQVGDEKFVVVAHSPTLRSTYAYVLDIVVAVGDRVVGGQRLATAKPGFHLTARVRGLYVDPMLFLAQEWSVRLVALPESSPRLGRLLSGPR